jgi:hypothetical protein
MSISRESRGDAPPDDALERAAAIIGGQATSVTMVYGTSIVGNCACPV